MREVVELLELDIVLGRLLPRERLIEEDLVERLGVGRHIIRRALLELEAMGVVVHPRNKSASVRDMPPEEVEQIYAVRELLEGHAAELIPLPPQNALVDHLHDIQSRHTEAVQNRDPAEIYRQNMLFHRTFFGACRNGELAGAVKQFAVKVHIARSSTINDPHLMALACEEHEKILEAMRDGDRQTLVRVVKAHIQPSKRSYIDAYRRRFGGPARRRVSVQ